MIKFIAHVSEVPREFSCETNGIANAFKGTLLGQGLYSATLNRFDFSVYTFTFSP